MVRGVVSAWHLGGIHVEIHVGEINPDDHLRTPLLEQICRGILSLPGLVDSSVPLYIVDTLLSALHPSLERVSLGS